MDLTNDELAYTANYREIEAYKRLENVNEMIHPDSQFTDDVQTLREYFRMTFNKKVSKEGQLK